MFFSHKDKVFLVPGYFYIHGWPSDIWFILLITKSITCQFYKNTSDALILLIKKLKIHRHHSDRQGGQTHRNIILSIPQGSFHQLCTNHSAVVLWHWSFTRSTWDQSLFYGPSWNLCFYALYKLQIQSWRNQNTWLRHWMYRLFQPTENEKGACKHRSSFSMQTHPI